MILCCVSINDGVEVILSSFLNPILKATDPRFNNSVLSLMTSLFFIGIIAGALSSGKLSDCHGRRSIIIYGALLQILAGAMFYLSKSVGLMLLVRLGYGFAFGFSNSVISTMFIEICPTKFRGRCLVFLGFFVLCGCFPSFVALFGCSFLLY